MITRVALIGFGEVGQILAADLAGRAEVAVWDIAFASAESVPSRALAQHRVRTGRDAADAVRDAELVSAPSPPRPISTRRARSARAWGQAPSSSISTPARPVRSAPRPKPSKRPAAAMSRRR